MSFETIRRNNFIKMEGKEMQNIRINNNRHRKPHTILITGLLFTEDKRGKEKEK